MDLYPTIFSKDIWRYICSYLQPVDVVKLICSCKTLNLYLKDIVSTISELQEKLPSIFNVLRTIYSLKRKYRWVNQSLNYRIRTKYKAPYMMLAKDRTYIPLPYEVTILSRHWKCLKIREVSMVTPGEVKNEALRNRVPIMWKCSGSFFLDEYVKSMVYFDRFKGKFFYTNSWDNCLGTSSKVINEPGTLLQCLTLLKEDIIKSRPSPKKNKYWF